LAPVPACDIRFPPDVSPDARDRVAAALVDFETAAIHELSDTEWRVFFRSAGERDRAAAALAAHADARPIDVHDEDWARRSQQDLKSVQVGTVIVAPPWDVPAAGAAHVIVIEPSTGFGTGHHATTRLCLRALQQIDLAGKRVLDVGTGSGVLAIAASKLGAAVVVAVDNDPDALAAARENVRRNGARVEVELVDLERTRLEPADVVLANLTGGMLQRTADTLAPLARGGRLIVSGLLDEEEAPVSRAFAPYVSSTISDHESGWTSLTLTIP
jgi:ribosomal protein L11 methyltransferase